MTETTLPSHWHIARITELVDRVQSVNPISRGEGKFKYVDISSVDNEQKIIIGSTEIENADAPSRARQVIATNDVLVSTVRPNLNAVALVPPELDGEICSTGFCILRAKKNLLHPEYLFAWVRHPNFVANLVRLERGIGYPAVSDSEVKNQQIPLPPPLEQQRIVAILKQADELRQKRRAANERAQELIQALFYEMFGDPATNPKKCDTLFLRDAVEINPRLNKSNYDSDLQVTFVPMSAVDEKEGRIAHPETKSFGEVSKGFTPFRNNDVLFAKITPSMENGKSAIAKNLVNGIGFGSTEFHVLRPTARTTSDYILQFVRRPDFRKHAEQNFVGTAGQQRVPQKFLENYVIAVPPVELQREFSARVLEIRRVQEKQNTSTQKLETLFDSLLAQAFTGELTETWRAQNWEAVQASAREMRAAFPETKTSEVVIAADEDAVTQLEFKITDAAQALPETIRQLVQTPAFPKYWTLLDLNAVSAFQNISRAMLREAVELLVVLGELRPAFLVNTVTGIDAEAIPAYTRVTDQDKVGASEIRL